MEWESRERGVKRQRGVEEGIRKKKQKREKEMDTKRSERRGEVR